MEIQHDGNGNVYTLIGQPDGTQFRITFYPAPGLWSGEAELRFVRQIGSKLDAGGPSIPLSWLGDMEKAIMELILLPVKQE